MNKKFKMRVLTAMLVTAQCLSPLALYAAVNTPVIIPETTSVYEQRFLELYEDIKDPNNGYFNEQGIPYHAVETLVVEAPDQGHESTSETASYLLWLEAMNGEFTGDFSGVEEAWDIIEDYYIPTDKDQPLNSYNPNSPATYAAEYPLPDYYPSELQFGTAVGQDPLYNELKSTYGKSQMYGMHWLIDVDNFYGYGVRGDGVSTPSYINTYQRGEQESVFETIPHPSWEDYSWGGENGFLPFFTGDRQYSKQWRYTIASDADARLVQAMYRAQKWAEDEGVNLDTYVEKASKIGDYLRYSMFDKYFMKIGAQGLNAATGKDSAHYLLSWYYSWGGALDGSWSWRIGSSHNHFGYQNPLAAYVLSTDEDFIPKSATAQSDWAKSLDRQLEFYQWLQSAEGGIAGGATNSVGGSYEEYPEGTSTFYGMAYDEHPVYEDPGSNEWFGMQCWSMQRMAEYYYESGDVRAKNILDKWAAWAQSIVRLNEDGTFEIPATLKWSGQPDTWTGSYTGNPNLHVDVVAYGKDLGVAASLANTLTYYAAATKKHAPEQEYASYVDTAKEILDRMWNLYRDDIGVATEEVRDQFNRIFEQEVAVPSDYTGTMANGDQIVPGATFLSIRSNYENDPDFARLKESYENGEDFTITYHRFWAQAEIAIANGTMAEFFPYDEEAKTPIVSITTPVAGTVVDYTVEQAPITVAAQAEVEDSTISKIDFYADGEKIGEATADQTEVSFVPTREGANEDGLKEITLTAVATSAQGVVKTSDPVKVQVQFKVTSKPTVTITAPEADTVIDATEDAQTVEVKADAVVEDSEVATVIVYANGNEIGRADGASCTAVYTTADEYGPAPDGLTDVVFTATAITKDEMAGEADPVSIKVQLPVKPEPTVAIDVAINNQSGVSTNTLGGQFVVTTDGEIDLSKLAIRYYYTAEGEVDQTAFVDSAALSLNREPWYVAFTDAVNKEIVKVEDNKYYLELTFNTNESLNSADKLEMGIRLSMNDWSNFDQSDDYSYNEGAVVLYEGSVVTGEMPY